MPQRPNIVWVIPDDTNHGMLGYAGVKALSPNIDSIAHNGVILDQFHCVSPACGPSRYSYLTGHYGGRCPADSFVNGLDVDCFVECLISHAIQPVPEPSALVLSAIAPLILLCWRRKRR